MILIVPELLSSNEPFCHRLIPGLTVKEVAESLMPSFRLRSQIQPKEPCFGGKAAATHDGRPVTGKRALGAPNQPTAQNLKPKSAVIGW
jgi:hypothetical protein